MRLNKRAQSVTEYALLITLILVAFVTIQTYVKRAIVGKFKDTADSLGEQFTANKVYNITTTQVSKRIEEVNVANDNTTWSSSQIDNATGFTMIGTVFTDATYDGYEATIQNTTDFDSGNLTELNPLVD